ncbi:unnamed protein product, partial [Symbiodinium microadriaticum]
MSCLSLRIAFSCALGTCQRASEWIAALHLLQRVDEEKLESDVVIQSAAKLCPALVWFIFGSLRCRPRDMDAVMLGTAIRVCGK